MCSQVCSVDIFVDLEPFGCNFRGRLFDLVERQVAFRKANNLLGVLMMGLIRPIYSFIRCLENSSKINKRKKKNTKRNSYIV